MSSLNNKHLFLIVLQGPVLQTSCFIDNHFIIVSSHGGEREGVNFIPFNKITNSITGALPHNLITTQKPHLQIPLHYGFNERILRVVNTQLTATLPTISSSKTQESK